MKPICKHTHGRLYFALTGAALAAGLAICQPALAEVSLTAAGYAQPTHVMHQSLAEFLSRIESKSGGEIKTTFHPTGSLVGAKDMLAAGRSDTVDIVSIATSIFPGELPFSGDAGTLLSVWNLDNFDKALDVLRPHLQKELEAQNLHLLWVVGTVTQWFMKERTDLDHPDWTGRKVRAFGGNSDKVVEIMGGTLVSVANNEIPTAAATGVIDGVGTSLGSFMGFGIFQENSVHPVRQRCPLDRPDGNQSGQVELSFAATPGADDRGGRGR